MIINIEENNIIEAAKIHSESWKESHENFCSKDFIEQHTIEHQETYLRSEIEYGKNLYMLVEKVPVGIVSVHNNLIENLYISPMEQNKGYGTQLLKFALQQCTSTPTLWILNNNYKAYSFYYKHGFRKTGAQNRHSEAIYEIELIMCTNGCLT